MTHIWPPTLFPRGIIIFQGVLTKFNFFDKISTFHFQLGINFYITDGRLILCCTKQFVIGMIECFEMTECSQQQNVHLSGQGNMLAILL